MSETKMSDYIKRLEETGSLSLEQLLKHLDPQRDQKTAQKPDKGAL